MIKSNKVNQKILFPKLIQKDENKSSRIEPIKLKYNQIKSKQKQIDRIKAKENSKPKQITSTTLYLQFPIGNKSRRKCSETYELPYIKLSAQSGYDDGVFMKRQFCAQYKKDMRGRIHKYNEERLQCMSERNRQQKANNQNIKISQCRLNKTIMAIQKIENPLGLMQIKNEVKPSQNFNSLSVSNQKVTRWDNTNEVNFEQSNDSFFEEIVEQLKLQNKNEVCE